MNPLYNTNQSPNNATAPAKAVTDTQVFVNRNRNTFDLSYFNYKTQRFGQYEPFFVMEGVPGDTIPLSSSHNVRSLPMQSPFLSSLTLSKDYFMVPMQAILPNTWEMIFSNPASGDDVPDDANCLCTPFALYNLIQYMPNTADFDVQRIKLVFALESIYSSGSLLASLGYNIQDTIEREQSSFDYCFNKTVKGLDKTWQLTFALPDGTTAILATAGAHSVPLSVLVDFTRQNYIYLTAAARIGSATGAFTHALGDWKRNSSEMLAEWASTKVNLSRVLAYQLCCHQFYVNTKIDPIYNAQLFRDNFFYLLKTYADARSRAFTLESFTRNGISVPYDYFSEHYLNTPFKLDVYSQFSKDSYDAFFNIIYYLFSYKRVLKFGDYFSASRTQPLGTDVAGQMNAPVVGEKVAAIDMSKSIVMQRFLNNVVKLGNDFGDYLRGIFGREPSPDYHFPKFISHQEFDVSGFEVANTADTKQGDMVTNLKSGDDKYAFEVSIDMPCILLGISNFNCPRVYGNARPRFIFHKDRFDMFNPMLQYIGDQALMRGELNTDSVPDEVFGYNSRNSEYKQSFSVASGGFIRHLPSWTLVADFGPDYQATPHTHQSSEFIRVYPFEFDKFFNTLSDLSLAGSFQTNLFARLHRQNANFLSRLR